MKCLIVVAIALVALVAADDEWKPEVDDGVHKKWHQECIPVSGVTPDQREKMNEYEFPDEKEVHEHFLCLVKKAGLFTDENGYSADRLRTQFAALRFEKAIPEIPSCVGSSDAETTGAVRAYSEFMCILKNMKKNKDKKE